MRRSLPVLVGLVLALASVACQPDKGFKTERISQSDYGDAWPLTVDEVVLGCEPGGVPTLTDDGVTYGLDDWELERDEAPDRRNLTHIWARDDAGELMSMDVLLEDALDLCE